MLEELILAGLVSGGWLLVLWWSLTSPLVLWPDSKKYLALAAGQSVPGPFPRRWLLPEILCGTQTWRWRLVTYGAILASALLLTSLTGSAKSAFLLMGLYGLVWMGVAGPILVDLPAFALALGGVVAWGSGHGFLACVLVTLAGYTKESAPFFAAAWSLNPIFLSLGLVCVGMNHVTGSWWGEDGGEGEPWLKKSLKDLLPMARRAHPWLAWERMLAPWGALVLLFPLGLAEHGLDRVGVAALLSLALAYGQLLVASDESRLFQWALPAVAMVAVGVEGAWVWPLLLIHLFCPVGRVV